MTTELTKYRLRATGPSRAGCHDLPELNISEWHAMGGVDVQVWDTDWTIDGTRGAIVHVCELYRIAFDEDELEER
jgi:hypothetical protein